MENYSGGNFSSYTNIFKKHGLEHLQELENFPLWGNFFGIRARESAKYQPKWSRKLIFFQNHMNWNSLLRWETFHLRWKIFHFREIFWLTNL